MPCPQAWELISKPGSGVVSRATQSYEKVNPGAMDADWDEVVSRVCTVAFGCSRYIRCYQYTYRMYPARSLAACTAQHSTAQEAGLHCIAFAVWRLCCAVLCCDVLWRAVLRCALLRHVNSSDVADPAGKTRLPIAENERQVGVPYCDTVPVRPVAHRLLSCVHATVYTYAVRMAVSILHMCVHIPLTVRATHSLARSLWSVTETRPSGPAPQPSRPSNQGDGGRGACTERDRHTDCVL